MCSWREKPKPDDNKLQGLRQQRRVYSSSSYEAIAADRRRLFLVENNSAKGTRCDILVTTVRIRKRRSFLQEPRRLRLVIKEEEEPVPFYCGQKQWLREAARPNTQVLFGARKNSGCDKIGSSGAEKNSKKFISCCASENPNSGPVPEYSPSCAIGTSETTTERRGGGGRRRHRRRDRGSRKETAP